jgi:hypothetical protein
MAGGLAHLEFGIATGPRITNMIQQNDTLW